MSNTSNHQPIDKNEPASNPQQPEPAKDEKVGYCNPPKSSRFKPGKSGNPSGRKKAPVNLSDQIFKVLNQKITVVENGKKQRRTKLQVMLISIANKAVKGDLKSAAFLLKIQENHKGEQSTSINTALLENDATEIIDLYFEQQKHGQSELSPDDFEPMQLGNLSSQNNLRNGHE